ncbi:hypothetical protein ACFYO7_30945 [Nocardia salmonicida]|uniref:hypothetical protein n=1 Tax=Nocardia salmonicida TaxID=53431 RepID=UPI00368C7723
MSLGPVVHTVDGKSTPQDEKGPAIPALDTGTSLSLDHRDPTMAHQLGTRRIDRPEHQHEGGISNDELDTRATLALRSV